MHVPKFHIVKIINEGVDAVRREEVIDNEALKRTRYIWLKMKPIALTNRRASWRILVSSTLKHPERIKYD
ncbi:MAG: hypothetical protein ACI9Y1_003307 [Lentisphaeria bacterium]|jgi:hypothetical protein